MLLRGAVCVVLSLEVHLVCVLSTRSWGPYGVSVPFDVSPHFPYFLKPTLLGLPTTRLEPPSVSDGGDVSPVGLGATLTIVEPLSPSDTPTEENLERDR